MLEINKFLLETIIVAEYFFKKIEFEIRVAEYFFKNTTSSECLKIIMYKLQYLSDII